MMRALGLQGVLRGKPVRTTISDKAAPCPLDRVNRQFQAPRPNALWVSDFTYVATRAGFVYVAFVIDTFARRITSRSNTPSAWPRPGSSRPSVASATATDNALAETINGLYKAEVIHRRGPWRSFEAVEFATLEYIYTPPQCGRGAGHAWLMTPLSRSALISSGV
jgi:transposase InsO family protein